MGARWWMETNLTESASNYARYAEDTISTLQKAYLKKYHPRQYSHSTQDAPNIKPEGKKSGASRQQKIMLETEPAQSDDGITDLSNIC